MLKKTTKVYRPIFLKAWEITRQKKFLWVFGLFAALAGNGGIYEILYRGFERVAAQGAIFFPKTNLLWQLGLFIFPRTEEMAGISPFFPGFFWLIFLIVLIGLAVAIWLVVTSRIALISCTQKIIARKKVDLKEGWASGKKYFWPTLALNALAKGLIFGFLILITIPVMFFITGGSGGFGWNLFLYILSFVVFTCLAVFVSFLAIYASCFVIIGEKTFLDAIQSSWRLFIKNWLTSIEMALILALVVLGVGIGIVLFTLVYLIPVILLLTTFAYLELTFGFWLIIFLAALGWLAALFLTGALLSTFQFSAWTLLFLELNKKRVWSKLLRFVGIK